MLRKIGKWIRICCWIPLVLGMTGYWIVGKEPFWQSLYASIALYFVNPVSDVTNVWVILAEYLAVLVTASVVLMLLEAVMRALEHRRIRMFRDGTAIYSDDELGEIVRDNLKHSYLCPVSDDADGRFKVQKTSNHVLMFSNDIRNMEFYTACKKAFSTGRVFILMRQTDLSLLKALSEPNVRFFHLYTLMARMYWHENSLYAFREQTQINVGIVGFGEAGRAIFRYGFLNNLFLPEQRIVYHIWNCPEQEWPFMEFLSEHTGNRDAVVLHREPWYDQDGMLYDMDRIILAESEPDVLSVLQTILLNRPDAVVHCFDGEDAEFSDYFASDNLISFGHFSEVLTDDNIRGDRLSRLGKLFHYDYMMQGKTVPEHYEEEMELAWNALDGFKKSSSIARGDYYRIVRQLRKDYPQFTEEVYQELEHIRWCRFHYINHWTFAEKRDNSRHQHNLLVPYSALSSAQKQLDSIHSEILRKEIEDLCDQ